MDGSCVTTSKLSTDMSAELKDHLTALPTELQHHIIGFLLPTHNPDRDLDPESSDFDNSKSNVHPLDYLAATCKSLREETMAWSRMFLIKHCDITKYDPRCTDKLRKQRNDLRGRNGLLTWCKKHCVFCGRQTSRSAILMNGFRCCSSCDWIQWPHKITATDAKENYDLRDDHLFTSKHHTPSLARLLAQHPGGFPKLRYGIDPARGRSNPIFLRKDVEAVAKLAYGDLREHLAKKKAERDDHLRKVKEAEAKWAEEKARRAAEAAAASAKLAHDREVLTQLLVDRMNSEEPLKVPDTSTEPMDEQERFSRFLAGAPPWLLGCSGEAAENDLFFGSEIELTESYGMYGQSIAEVWRLLA